MTQNQSVNTETYCPNYFQCSCPLCPLDQESLQHGVWYSNESVCNRKDFQSLDWIVKQRAIARMKSSTDKYFSISMLLVIKTVTKRIQGISPDNDQSIRKKKERAWIQEHVKLPLFEQKVGVFKASKTTNLVASTIFIEY
jgi:hypothetical protein